MQDLLQSRHQRSKRTVRWKVLGMLGQPNNRRI
jgi:hypothetical protein